MSRSAKRRKNTKKSPPVLLIAIGSALVLFGLLNALWNSRSEPTPDSRSELTPESSGPSAIPVEVKTHPAPQLSLQGLDGKPVSLSDFHGQVVLLNNWATWCPPCKAEMPDLEAYYEAHQAEGFTVIAVNAGDPPAEVGAFAQQYGLTFPVWPDPNTETLRAFGIQGLPTSFIIDRDGMVRATWTGAITRATLEKYVTPYIEEQN